MTGTKERGPSHSSAFEEKCAREQEKLYASLTKRLADDLLNLLESETETDLTVTFKSGDVQCHSCIISARLPELWDKILKNEVTRGQVQEVISKEIFMQILRFIYTENDLSPILDHVEKLKSLGTDVEESPKELEQAISNGDQATNGHIQSGNTEPGLDVELAESYCELGRDLLKMFHRSTHSNVVVLVKDTALNLHRCLLCARSRYFSAMLGGQWKESAARQINLQGIHPSAMTLALIYMYGGLPTLPPEGSSHMAELVTIADMYGLTGLREILEHNYRRGCHYFHKPCSECIPAVIAVLPVAHLFSFEELYDRALRWCSRHVSRVWGNKAFASLSADIQDACLQKATDDITNDAVIDTILECDRLAGSLTNVRWSEPVVTMATQLMDACIDHLKNNFVEFSKTNKFLSLGKTMALSLGFLTDIFGRAIITMPAGKACATYRRVDELQVYTTSDDCTWTEDFKQMICHLVEKCEHFMRLYVNQLINTDEWNSLLSHELQERVKQGAWYVCVGDGRRMRGPPRVLGFTPRTDDKSSNQKTGMSTRPKTLPGSRRQTRKPKPDPSGNPTKTSSAKTGAKRSTLPRPKNKTKAKSPGDSKVFKTVVQAEEEAALASELEDRPHTIKPKVRKSLTSNDSWSPESRSRISSVDSAPDNPLNCFMAQSFIKTKVDNMSVRSYPSNAATVNSNLTTPNSDVCGSDISNYTSNSEVFCSPEREVEPMGGARFEVPPTISEVMLPEVQVIHFVISSFFVNLQWLFFCPEEENQM